MPVAYRTSKARPAGRYAPSDRRMRSPCRPPRQISGAVQPARWSYSLLTFPGGKAMPTLWPARPAWRLSTGTARSWTLAGHAASSRPSAGRTAQPETVMLSCSPTRRSWSATCRASGSARRRPGSGAATGRSAPIRRMPIRPGWRACSSCAWLDCPAGDIPAAAAGHRAVAVSFRKPTRTPRWPALRNFGDDTERPRYKCKPPPSGRSMADRARYYLRHADRAARAAREGRPVAPASVPSGHQRPSRTALTGQRSRL